MPFVFIFVGIAFLVSGVRGTSSSLLSLLEGDLTGTNAFGYWLLSIFVVGAIGYIPEFKGISRAFLVLVLVVLILNEDKQGAAGGGFFASFQSQFSQITGKQA
jgi:hypothetical protein